MNVDSMGSRMADRLLLNPGVGSDDSSADPPSREPGAAFVSERNASTTLLPYNRQSGRPIMSVQGKTKALSPKRAGA